MPTVGKLRTRPILKPSTESEADSVCNSPMTSAPLSEMEIELIVLIVPNFCSVGFLRELKNT